MKIVHGDLLSINHGIICHQANCLGAMGAGIAGSIARKWPSAYNDYREAYKAGRLALGNVVYSPITATLHILHLCGQHNYGRIPRQYTNYEALDKCLEKVVSFKLILNSPVFFPKGMGCMLGGGDWKIVSALIDKHLPDSTVVELVK